MPVCPKVERTIVLAERSKRVRLMEAMAKGAPWERIFFRVVRREERGEKPETIDELEALYELEVWDVQNLAKRSSLITRQWERRIAMPTRCPTTVAADDPVIPQPNNWMNTMSRARLTTLSMITATDTSFG